MCARIRKRLSARWATMLPMSVAAVRAGFEATARKVAEEVVAGPVVEFRPQRMSKYAHWYLECSGERLIAVVNPDERPLAGDEVLAFGLAWQQDRDLVLVLPPQLQLQAQVRLPWIDTTVRLWGLDLRSTVAAPLAALSRPEALQLMRMGGRGRAPYVLPAQYDGWLDGIDRAGLVAHSRSCLSWHADGLQVLRVAGTKQGLALRIQAGVQYSNPALGVPYDRTFTRPPTPSEIHEINAEIRVAVARGSRTSHMLEHKMQATLATQAASLDAGMVKLAREYPAFRGPMGAGMAGRGRPGFIDFLGVDAQGGLHVVETKIGHDAGVVLQALDYAVYVKANEAEIGRDLHLAPVQGERPVKVHLVLASKSRNKAVNPYLAGQVEALSHDVTPVVHLVDDPAACPLALHTPSREALWQAGPQVAKPVTGPRWPQRITNALALA